MKEFTNAKKLIIKENIEKITDLSQINCIRTCAVEGGYVLVAYMTDGKTITLTKPTLDSTFYYPMLHMLNNYFGNRVFDEFAVFAQHSTLVNKNNVEKFYFRKRPFSDTIGISATFKNGYIIGLYTMSETYFEHEQIKIKNVYGFDFEQKKKSHVTSSVKRAKSQTIKLNNKQYKVYPMFVNEDNNQGTMDETTAQEL